MSDTVSKAELRAFAERLRTRARNIEVKFQNSGNDVERVASTAVVAAIETAAEEIEDLINQESKTA